MASATSLLGLVNQLQTMEASFCDVLMEAALKLASLTDANVFVLVETAEGRRFAGKRHLCDSYLGGALCPLGNDVELEVDPSVRGLRQRMSESRIPCQYQPTQHVPSRFDPTNGSLPPFAPADLFPNTQFIRKRSHLGSGMSSHPSPRKQSKLGGSTAGHGEDVTVVKEEREIFLDDNDVVHDVVEDDVIEAFDGFTPKGVGPGNGDEAVGFNDLTASKSSSHRHKNSDSMGVLPLGSGHYSEGYDFSTDFDPEDLFRGPKLVTLEAICTHETLGDKTTYASKLLSSFITDCGKALIKGCVKNNTHPDDRRAYFAQGFEFLWASLPFLKRLDEDGLRIQKGLENRRLSLRATVRDKMLTTFRAHMKRGPDRGLSPCANQRPQPQLTGSSKRRSEAAGTVRPVALTSAASFTSLSSINVECGLAEIKFNPSERL